MKVQNHVQQHSRGKTPNKNPRPHFEPKGEVEFFLLLHTGLKPGSLMENCTVSTNSEMSLALIVAGKITQMLEKNHSSQLTLSFKT